MNAKDFSMALGEVNDRYITEATTYEKSPPKAVWLRWVAVAACFAIVVASLFVISTLKHPTESPFVITAYAMTDDSTLAGHSLIPEGPVQTDAIELSDGTKILLFSCPLDDPNEKSRVSVVADKPSRELTFDDLHSFIEATGVHYYCYILTNDMDDIQIDVIMESGDGEFYLCEMEIVANGDGYYLTLMRKPIIRYRELPRER